jgi:uncharacterized protein YndB with AHSA1/START domain
VVHALIDARPAPGRHRERSTSTPGPLSSTPRAQHVDARPAQLVERVLATAHRDHQGECRAADEGAVVAGEVGVGRLEPHAPPALIALRWDFASDDLPVPGGEMLGYMRFDGDTRRARITVHQLVDDANQAALMQTTWSLVLGQARAGCVAALAGERDALRAARPRRRSAC